MFPLPDASEYSDAFFSTRAECPPSIYETSQHDRIPVTTKHEKRLCANPLAAAGATLRLCRLPLRNRSHQRRRGAGGQ